MTHGCSVVCVTHGMAVVCVARGCHPGWSNTVFMSSWQISGLPLSTYYYCLGCRLLSQLKSLGWILLVDPGPSLFVVGASFAFVRPTFISCHLSVIVAAVEVWETGSMRFGTGLWCEWLEP